MAFEKADGDMEDKQLPSLVTNAWPQNGISSEEHVRASDQDDTDAVVRLASGSGRINTLSPLYDKGQWNPRQCRKCVEEAYKGG